MTALVRLRNEAEWLRTSIYSIIDKVDEVGLFLQGEQDDGTDVIANALRIEYPDKIFVKNYPFLSVPNGPGHDKQPWTSLYSRAYFYNWCLGHAGRNHVLKWDGDCVAHDDFEPRDLARKYDRLFIRGTNMADMNRMCLGEISGALCLFRIAEDTYWKVGNFCEIVSFTGKEYPLPGFLHFKWAKDHKSATKAWPDNWAEIHHFRRIYEAGLPRNQYKGPMPSCLTRQTSS